MDNPLGSDENAGGLKVSKTEEVTATSIDKPGVTSSDDASTTGNDVLSTSGERSPSFDGVENNEETESKENVTEEPGDEGDDFEGGLC